MNVEVAAGGVLTGSRSSMGMMMMTITKLAMMSSPAAAGWTQEKNREKEEGRKNRLRNWRALFTVPPRPVDHFQTS